MLDGRDQHAAPTLGLLRGAADILPIHGDRGAAPVPEAFRRLAPAARILFILCDFAWMLALLAGPVRQRGFQRLRRQGREDVVERRDRRVGVALPAGAVETACGLELLLAQQAGELREGRHAAVAGQPRGDRQHEHGAQAVALAPRVTVLRHGAEELAQAAQPGRLQWRGSGRRA